MTIRSVASSLSAKTHAALSHLRGISRLRILFSAGLLALVLGCLAISWNTQDAMAHLPFLNKQGGRARAWSSENNLVDTRPWQTAQALAPLAVSAEETVFAREAQRLADHEVDQAFASALRHASMRRRILTGEALKLSQKLTQLQRLVNSDQAHVQSLSEAAKASSTANGARTVLLSDDLDVAKAQLGLDSDELLDAQQDLARAAGDERNKVQRELAERESAMRKYDAQAAKATPVAAASVQRYGSLARRVKAWLDQRSRYQLIRQAGEQAQADAAALIARHNRLEGEANTIAPSSAAEPEKTAKLATLAQRTAQRQLLSIYDDRIETEQQLASVYSKWSEQVLLQHRIVLHLLMGSVALIAVILLCVILSDALVRSLVNRYKGDRRQTQALRTILGFGIQVAGALLIALAVFGVPNQMPTIIGFTTAGITVVLQDFILAFLGWFVLMGKNGIRVGDWVEINGVSGEVVETGVFRTALLETGNGTDKGHPTGRRVTLINSFAIKGQYFNFSTTGQWMWDEIVLTIPSSEDTYRKIELIHKAVLKETEEDTRLAEAEWQRVAYQNGVSQFTAAPAVDMRPGVYGIDIVVRYITRAADRFQVRNRLYQHVIGVLQKPAAAEG